ncbi:amino acid adenylation domain-containing protein [Allokutzneria sp. A3M-2-11 16]|uniref:amino acid adenylation domain-containing protein n=1 Tax=Allokutzneria sp. A3M-2-11 16 TaxID=2962043 RepID=UPI0020B787F1|nr:amino acid adenylation domain-containing protein [Allokutzneria sp. A3M-2-11 16]MCP3803372.1 amino acid adenylation domain-containing protein [Allokutzneria sp. A3M-2-11 16]
MIQSGPDPLDRFRAWVTATPDATAVSVRAEHISYAELDRLADAFAERVLAAGLVRGQRVGVRLSRSVWLPAVIIGLFRAGIAYVPFDPAHDSGRADRIAESAGLAAQVIDGAGEPELTALDVDAPVDPRDVRYVIFTSGSTGTPKGVPVTRQNMTALFEAALPLFDFVPADRWALSHSYGFDVSVWEMWGALSTGACLAVPGEEVLRSAELTVRHLVEERVSVLNQVPSVFAHAVRYCAASGTTLPEVRHVVLAGEAMQWDSVLAWRRLGNRAEVTNMYGPTETTVYATFRRIGARERPHTHRTPLGAPLPGFEFRVVGEDGSDVAEGEIGELLLRGPQVFDGYLGLPGPFVADAAGGAAWYRTGDLVTELGELLFVGRVDGQVKLRGFRVELGEVEHAVRELGLVEDAAVTVGRTATDEPVLVAHVVARAGERGGLVEQVREALAARLPSYMVPGRIELVERLALTASGKLDRRALG